MTVMVHVLIFTLSEQLEFVWISEDKFYLAVSREEHHSNISKVIIGQAAHLCHQYSW